MEYVMQAVLSAIKTMEKTPLNAAEANELLDVALAIFNNKPELRHARVKWFAEFMDYHKQFPQPMTIVKEV